MARNRVFRPTSSDRYVLKMYRLYSGLGPEGLVLRLVDNMRAAWERGFGEYHKAWQQLLASGIVSGLARGQRAFAKAVLNRFLRAKARGVDMAAARDRLIDDTVTMTGLPREVVERIYDFVQGYTA